jgi:hypothetical protein
MNLKSFLEKLKQTPQNITFTETIAVMKNYVFHQQHSKTEYSQCSRSSGSCKLFTFANCKKLSEAATLSCFGAYYQEDVLGDRKERVPKHSQLHENWLGRIAFYGEALELKKTI